MQLGDKDIDQLFKESLEERHTPMDENAWKQMQSQLKGRKKERDFFGLWFIPILLIFGALNYLLGKNASENTHLNGLVKSKITVVEKLKEKSAIKENTETKLIGGLDDKLILEQNVVTKKNIEEAEIGVKEIRLNKSTKQSIKPSKNISKRKTSTLENSKGVNASDLNNKLNTPIKKPNTILENTDDKTQKNLLNNKEKESVKNMQVYEPIGGKIKRGLALIGALILKPLSNNAVVKINKDTTPKMPKNISWSLGLYGGLGSFLDNKAISLKQNPYTLDLEAKSSYLLGFNIKSEFKKIGLSAGLEYQKYNFIESLSGVTKRTINDTAYDVISKNRVVDGRTYWVIDEKVTTTVVEEQNEYLNGEQTSVAFIQIPLELSYRIKLLNKFSLIPSLGARVNIPVGVNAFRINGNNSNLSTLNKKDIKSSTNLLAGLSLAYSISPKWEMGLTSRYVNGLSLQNSLDASLKRNILNNTLCLRYHFGR